MLEFAENVFYRIKRLRQETHEMVLAGNIRDMEHYKFLMGRLEGYSFVENEIKTLLDRQKEPV